jgi:DNA helicase II / ATP-dependent DNA helicase PcrA
MGIFDTVLGASVPSAEYEWSDYQKGVFDWVRSGVGGARINAVAGSGKTSTIVAASSMASGTAVFCAFNKHIEEELSTRLTGVVGCKTIHSMGYEAVRSSCGKVKLDNKKYNEICQKAAASAFTKSTQAGLEHTRSNIYKMLRKAVDMVRYTLCDPENFATFDNMCTTYALSLDKVTRKIVFEYIAPMIKEGNRLCSEGCIDFTDMIYYPVIKKIPLKQYSWVMVDEAQDLSATQLAIVVGSLKKNGRLVAVGDPHQSIYGFTGADPWSFRNIGKYAADELPLSICYRCPESVVSMARNIVPQIEPRPNAPKGIVLQVHDISDMLRKGDMVVCRRNAPLVVECLKAIAAGKNACIRGMDLKDSLLDIVAAVQAVPGHEYRKFEVDLAIVQMQAMSKLIADGDDEAAARIGDVYDALLGIYTARRPATILHLKDLINQVFEEGPDSIVFSSIHRAKGLEAERVFLVDAGNVRLRWKNQKPWQEYQEQCCEYVALTRAKAELYIATADGSRYSVGKPVHV